MTETISFMALFWEAAIITSYILNQSRLAHTIDLDNDLCQFTWLHTDNLINNIIQLTAGSVGSGDMT